MSLKIRFDDGAYSSMLDCIITFHNTNIAAANFDVDFIQDDYWLQNTAVIENIERRKGCWQIYLVFAHHRQPLKFIKRSITSSSCYSKAVLMAHYMRRLAAKDQRGTLVINMSDVNFNFN